MTVRIVLADDHHVVREGLRILLDLDPELEVVGEAADGVEAIQLARSLAPDLVLMDLAMPVMDGIAATAAIRRDLPSTEVLALTSVLNDASIVGAINAGAIGYLLKDTHAAILGQAVKAAAQGQVQLSPVVAARLARNIACSHVAQPLSERESEVLQLLARGGTNREIAATLGVSSETIKTHVGTILTKLGARSRTQAALQAIRMGLLRPDDVGNA